MKRRAMPKQSPGSSKQDYCTPRGFLEAVEYMWGSLEIDLAATKRNAKAPEFITPQQDSLVTPWPRDKRCWLNPPFGDIRPWAKKCSETKLGPDGLILFLTPASVGANWFWEFVAPFAELHMLSPRLKFTGAKDPYPKDLMLSIFGIEGERQSTTIERWRWEDTLEEMRELAEAAE